MTREEMILKARETRKQVTNAPVSPELLAMYPADITEMEIETRVGISKVYDTTCDAVVPGGPLIINFHGGGFIRGRTPNDEVFCRRIANELGIRVLDVDYRIAPDDPFPAALWESYDVVQWAFAHAAQLQIDPARICLTGHSAGGNLICGICFLAKESGSFTPALNVIEYPPLDIKTDPADKPFRGAGIPYERARLYNLYYCEPEQMEDPLVSPIYAADEQLEGFPKTLMITAGNDDLCTEAEEFALRLARAGTEVTLKRFPEEGHAFTIYRRGNYEDGIQLIERFIRDNL